MSNIYIQDPPTKGKVVLETTLGELEIELWPKEAPLACRNFVQLCLDGYYTNCIFHRIVPGLLAQSGDPTGSGRGGASAWGRPFKDEFHSRLRFGRRGLIACANANAPDSNGSQFFVTLGPAPQLDRKYTIFGRVVGDTQYNIPRFEQLELGEDDRPVDPPIIKSTSVPWNPFDDVVPRASPAAGEVQAPVAQTKTSALPVKQERRLMSFADEEDEEDAMGLPGGPEAARGMRSAHDVLEDATLSKQAAVQVDVARIQEALRAAREEKERGKSIGHLTTRAEPFEQQSVAAFSPAPQSVAASSPVRSGEEGARESSDSDGSAGDKGAKPSALARQGKGKRSAPAAMAPSKQMTAADTDLLSSWERRRE
ncbi:cyclophilin type peptidyl-prolyl cis-trans isomerase, partial [Helicosporidium sp. ATCC 50920]